MTQKIIGDLGDGLILRSAVIEDTEELVDFNCKVHMDEGQEEPSQFIIEWVRDLMTKDHPTFKPGDFTVVVDTNTGKIVSSLNLIDQIWSYEGIEFGVGRPELVGTDIEYRNRGLVRAQFEVIHEWSKKRGHKLQAITGIPYYYRLFDYEMCVSLGGSRIGYLPHVPKLKADEKETYTFRPAEKDDLSFMMEIYENFCQRSMLNCVRDEAYWNYDLFVKHENACAQWMIIETLHREAVGLIFHPREIWNPIIQMWGYELKSGASYLDVTSSVIRYLVIKGKDCAERKEKIEFAGYSFGLGATHPAYDVLPERMPRIQKPYAWYMRIADLPDFLQHISPVLEERLAKSPVVGYSGDLKLGFYRSGVKLTFESGKIKNVEAYKPETGEDGDVLFPELTFLRVLLGYNTFDEVDGMLTDCFAKNDHGRALVKYLFPQKHSHIWAIN